MNKRSKYYSESAIQGRMVMLREKYFPGWGGKKKFADELGISPKQYGLYEESRLAPSTVLARAADVCGINIEWLVTGRGEMERGGVRQSVLPKIPVKGFREIGLLRDQDSLMGKKVAEIDNIYGYRGNNIFGLIFTGHSMEPVIPDGAFVVVDPDRECVPMQVVAYRLKSGPGVNCKLYLGSSGEFSYFASCLPGEERLEIKRADIAWLFPSIGVI